jgi:hypothetical protein
LVLQKRLKLVGELASYSGSLKLTQNGSPSSVSLTMENNPYCKDPMAADIRLPKPYNVPNCNTGNLIS